MAVGQVNTEDWETESGTWPVERSEQFNHFTVDTAVATTGGRGDATEVTFLSISSRYTAQAFTKITRDDGTTAMQSGALVKERVIREEARARMSRDSVADVGMILLKQAVAMGLPNEEVQDLLRRNGILK